MYKFGVLGFFISSFWDGYWVVGKGKRIKKTHSLRMQVLGSLAYLLQYRYGEWYTGISRHFWAGSDCDHDIGLHVFSLSFT